MFKKVSFWSASFSFWSVNGNDQGWSSKNFWEPHNLAHGPQNKCSKIKKFYLDLGIIKVLLTEIFLKSRGPHAALNYNNWLFSRTRKFFLELYWFAKWIFKKFIYIYIGGPGWFAVTNLWPHTSARLPTPVFWKGIRRPPPVEENFDNSYSSYYL